MSEQSSIVRNQSIDVYLEESISLQTMIDDRQSGNLANLITVHLALSQHLLAVGHCSKLKPTILSIKISI